MDRRDFLRTLGRGAGALGAAWLLGPAVRAFAQAGVQSGVSAGLALSLTPLARLLEHLDTRLFAPRHPPL